MPAARANRATAREWRKPVRVELTLPARGGKRPVLKTGRATGPHWLPVTRPREGLNRTAGLAARPAPGGLAVEQTDFSRARTLGRFFNLELDALSFAQQFEHGSSNGGAMEEVLDAAFVANEPETLID